MDFSDDLQRVLWHEFGHFCVNLLDSEVCQDYTIEDLWVSYHEKAISNHKWAGAVKMIPSVKWNILVEDLDKTSFSILSLISGCLFETIFLREFLGTNTKFTDCFCTKLNCGGRGDFFSTFMIYSEIRKKYGYNADFIKFVENKLPDIYYNKIVKDEIFMNQINKLIITKKEIILRAYNDLKDKDEFYYSFTDEISNLKVVVSDLLKDSSFIEIILDLKKSILEIIKKPPEMR